MPEPVTCHAPRAGSTTIECDDIAIGPEPPKTQQVEVHEGSAGARALVQSQTALLVVREFTPDPTDVPYADLALHCTAEAMGSALVAAGARRLPPPLIALSAVKASIDLAECLFESLQSAQIQSAGRLAIEHCESLGGTPIGPVDHTVYCLGGRTESSR